MEFLDYYFVAADLVAPRLALVGIGRTHEVASMLLVGRPNLPTLLVDKQQREAVV